MPDHEPIDRSQVTAVRLRVEDDHYGGPPPFHVRDQERRYAALPDSGLPTADRGALAPVRLAAYPATVWLPAPGAAEPMDVPEPEAISAWQGWVWPSDASVLIEVDRDPTLPGLRACTDGLPGSQRAALRGRPARVDRRDPDDTGTDYRGWVHGFLTDAVRVYAAVDAASVAERDALLSAVLTLAPDAGGPGEPDPPPDDA